ncbi:MAG: methionine--tRNA ligase [Bacilli bacterium]
MDNKFYIATSIPYAYAKPHIGNMYEFVLSDAIARYKRMKGFDVYFQTGSDEHGAKIENHAKKNNINSQDFVDENVKVIKNLCENLKISYSKFVRTTDKIHKKAVQNIFTKLYEKGDIYKGIYTGLYCTPCESFFANNVVNDNKCPDCNRELIEDKEEAYFLNLKKYEKELRKYLSKDVVMPEFRKKEIIKNFLDCGLEDLCITRKNITWGIKVPFDTQYVSYVWIDALSNYFNFFEDKIIPCDLHVIGKDILRFHIIYLPVIMMALNLELPKKFLAHSWVLAKDGKMSKSTGNVLYSDKLVEKYGLDTIRYYLLKEINYSNDGAISDDLIIERYNSDLANTLGNLVSRTIAMSDKYFEGIVINTNCTKNIDNEFKNILEENKEEYFKNMNEYMVPDAVENILIILRRANKYIDETTPWILGKEGNKERLNTVLYNLLEVIRQSTILLSPLLPDTSKKIFTQLNTNKISFETLEDFEGMSYTKKLGNREVLFNRLEQ